MHFIPSLSQVITNVVYFRKMGFNPMEILSASSHNIYDEFHTNVTISTAKRNQKNNGIKMIDATLVQVLCLRTAHCNYHRTAMKSVCRKYIFVIKSFNCWIYIRLIRKNFLKVLLKLMNQFSVTQYRTALHFRLVIPPIGLKKWRHKPHMCNIANKTLTPISENLKRFIA
jgi:hypothetical protein